MSASQQLPASKIALMNEDGGLDPKSEIGTGEIREEGSAPLSAIISYINDKFGTEFCRVHSHYQWRSRRVGDHADFCFAEGGHGAVRALLPHGLGVLAVDQPILLEG